MKLFIPNLEFEIRYPKILNFQNIYRKIHAPFIKLSQRITILNQNTVEERIILHFDPDNYQILSQWDRINIKCEGDYQSLCKSNSIVERPFFDIFKSIASTDTFTRQLNYVYLLVGINTDNLLPNPKERIKKEFFTDRINRILDDPHDLAIVLEKKVGGMEVNVTYGPYKGVADLINRNINIRNKVNIPDAERGEMVIIRIFEETNSVDFRKFREVTNEAKKIIQNIWP